MFKIKSENHNNSVQAFYCACACTIDSCTCDCMTSVGYVLGSSQIIAHGQMATANCNLGLRV